MRYATGLAPDPLRQRERDLAECPLSGAVYSTELEPILQPTSWVRDQGRRPSCVGQAIAASIDAIRVGPPYASAVSIWREARRRQGRIEAIHPGTRFAYAIAGLMFRGWDPYVEGEDADAMEAGLYAAPAGDDLGDELFADDTRAPGLRYYRIRDGDLDAVDAALAADDLGVVIGTGTRQPYHDYRGDPGVVDTVLTTDHLGGDADSHGQRVVGRRHLNGRRVYLLQNSWGERWGGCHLPDGG